MPDESELSKKIQEDIDKDVDTIFDTLKHITDMRQQKYGENVNIAIYAISVLALALGLAGDVEEDKLEPPPDLTKIELGVNAIMEEMPASLARMAFTLSNTYVDVFASDINNQKEKAN